MRGHEGLQMFCHAYGADARATCVEEVLLTRCVQGSKGHPKVTAAVRNAERLMQVEVTNIGPKVAWTTEPHLQRRTRIRRGSAAEPQLI